MDLKGDENLDFYVNKGEENPTTKKYDFKSTGNLGLGLIKTINNKSKYCTKIITKVRKSDHRRLLTSTSSFPGERTRRAQKF